MLSLLLMLGLFSACSESDDSESTFFERKVINNPMKDFTGLMKPVNDTKSYETIDSFFKSALPFEKLSDCFFVNSDNDECHVIDSYEDLNSIYSGDVKLPEFDFDHYMLIIGQKIMPDINNVILRQELFFNEDGYCQLNIYIPLREGGYTRIQNMYYWALYPKFVVKNINVKIIKEEV